MKKKDFADLLESVRKGGEIIRGERAPSREFHVDPSMIRQLRAKLELSQAKFAGMLGVPTTTLQNWEQGRREPTGPAKALLKAIRNDPRHVIKALAA